MMRTYKAIDIAHKVVNKTNVEMGDSITNLMLQKMLYYLQGFWLAFYDKPLFEEEIEAWPCGPVVPEVYETYKHYGKEAIPVAPYAVDDYVPAEDDPDLVFEKIYNLFSRYSAPTLLAFIQGSPPWKSAPRVGRGSVISRDVMRDYFITQIED